MTADTKDLDYPDVVPGRKSRNVTDDAEEPLPQRHETDVLVPKPGTVTLSNGLDIEILPLKTRAFFKLLKIVTHGGAPMLQRLQLVAAMESAEDFAAQLIAVVLFAVPEAEDEALDFVRSMVRDPENKIARFVEVGEGRRARQVPVAVLDEVLSDPDLDDLLTIIEAIVDREKEDLYALGKRLSRMFKLAEKTGQLEQTTTEDSSEDSLGLSTSSPPSTGGETKSSSTSQSRASVSASSPSESDDDSNSTSASDTTGP